MHEYYDDELLAMVAALTGGKIMVRISGTFVVKPVLVRVSGSFVTKPAEIRKSGSFVYTT